jgi:hypothetical protein
MNCLQASTGVLEVFDRRDGRPAQQINVTQFGVSITADEVAKARAIVRELRGDAPTLDSQAILAEVSPTGQD